jgi:hypothetical protein
MIDSTAAVPVNPKGETTLTLRSSRRARNVSRFPPRYRGPREGAIINELFEDESGALQLRFYGYLGLRGKEPGGPEEQAEQTWLDSDKGYKSALLSTLKRTRELLEQGRL